MKKLLLIMALGMLYTAQAQEQKVNVYGEDAYYIITNKTNGNKSVKFYYKYTLEEPVDKIESNYGGILGPPTNIYADVSIEGDYVVLKRMKAVQQSGYRFTIRFNELFAGKIKKRKGGLKNHLVRWTDMMIEAVEQY